MKNNQRDTKFQFKLLVTTSIVLGIKSFGDLVMMRWEINPCIMHFLNALLFLSICFQIKKQPGVLWNSNSKGQFQLLSTLYLELFQCIEGICIFMAHCLCNIYFQFFNLENQLSRKGLRQLNTR